jgi:arsenical pump membrane protein
MLLAGIARGQDVYLFLTGMMLLAELARYAGLFAWLAARTVRAAHGSAARLFALVYGAGVLVTVFLSNDATVVVLTPAVAAVAAAAGVAAPMPYLFACAFVANAASFVLPISNPANLVVYGAHMPPLLAWLPLYALPSAAAILATYCVLFWTQRAAFCEELARDVPVPTLSREGKLAAVGICATTLILLGASYRGFGLGWPTFLAGFGTALLVLRADGHGWAAALRGISWPVLLLVAGLFIGVEALERAGAASILARWLHAEAAHSVPEAVWAAGGVLGLGGNLVNNLPAGLLAGSVLGLAHVPDEVRAAALIGVDLGPNLCVTGSLATILWLAALRREGQRVSFWRFLKLGAVVMPPALLLALAELAAVG